MVRSLGPRVDLHRLEGFAGYLDPEEGRALYHLAKSVPADQAIVELGSYKGKSTSYLGQGSMAGAGALVYAVDLWDNLEGLRAEAQKAGNGMDQYNEPICRRIFDLQVSEAGTTSVVRPLVSETSAAGRAWDGLPVGLLFIDASHDEASVLADYGAWEPHLAPMAVVAFHDYARRFPGVWKAVKQLRVDHHWSNVKTVRTLHMALT